MREPADEPLLDWSAWQTYRQTVAHPAAIIKPADIRRARENQERHEWARRHVAELELSAQTKLQKLTPAWIATFIPSDTPGDTLFTPCPACRDLKMPAHPHGQYRWDQDNPKVMACQVCGTVFPNEKYPESLVFTTRYGGGQTLSFYGGPPFDTFGFEARPSFTANLRARQVAVAASACAQLAEAYGLTGKLEYAQAARLLLLRFAEVYPNWLVHVGYGEYADLDPHLAALNIDNLPADEITPTPGGPDRVLHSGYWQGGRATGTGMEAGFVRQMAEAYSFVCQAGADQTPVFSAEERIRIERDLLLESTVLLVADRSVNNKSVGNATAVALVGMVLGHPGMVRFGLDVFMKTVDGWFLPDGATSESFAYAAMTLGGIEATGQAFRGYSDPPGYKDAQGRRIDALDLYHDTPYKRVWEAMFSGLQGDLKYPPLADSYCTTALGLHNAELMADNYPLNPQYVALLKELAGLTLAGGDSHTAIYCRPPGLADVQTPPLALPDHLYPALQIGYLRSGETGRDSALVLSASDWGGHHHYDSLSLYYWQQGSEWLSDLGYLWDHPKKEYTSRTFAHNTVMVDGAEQLTTGRGGKFTLFAPQGQIRVMEAESKAYSQVTLYRRTIAQVEHAPGRRYVVDIFRVRGGRQHDYVVHGVNHDIHVEAPELKALAADSLPYRFCLRLALDAPGTEVYVDGVSVKGPDGKEMAPDPSAPDTDAPAKLPKGFGLYHGDGEFETGTGEAGGTHGACAYLKAVAKGKEQLNVALIIGASDGYDGAHAFEGKTDSTYTVSFRLKGKAASVKPSLLCWTAAPFGPAQRRYLTIKGLSALTAAADWVQYGGEFAVRSEGPDLQNAKYSDAVAQWRLVWKAGSGMQFAAIWPNEAGYTSILGDGWGQRDYRNSDVGATLPYIVRRHAAADTPTVYLSAFESSASRAGLVNSIRRLPIPGPETAHAVAVVVETTEGRDYLVSCLQSRPLRIETADGLLEVDGLFAAVCTRDGMMTAARLVEGTTLQLGGRKALPQQ